MNFTFNKKLFQSYFIIFMVGLIASCGLIYEYLISHYSGIVIGVVDKAIYGIIGIMLVAMGVGAAFAGRCIKDNYTSFVVLESVISITGSTAGLFLGASYAISYWIPESLYISMGLENNIFANLSGILSKTVSLLPYIAAFIMGFLIGMEIPILTSAREEFINSTKSENFSIMYGSDYAGAGIGAAVWVLWMLSLDVNTSSVIVSATNIFAGIIFLIVFWKKIQYKKSIILLKSFSILTVTLVSIFGTSIHRDFEDMLYKDNVIYSFNTHYQHITITEMDNKGNNVYSLFINNKLQFSSSDERLYHELLVQPVMNMNKKHEKVLLIGGGDGLALREIFKWNDVKSVTMLDLDDKLINFFSKPVYKGDKQINKKFIELNNNSFADKRLHLMLGDAYNNIDKIKDKFDVVIVDLPDPGNPNLNKLYSTSFYKKINRVMDIHGAMVIQSTSPYHAKNTFLSIRKTVESSKFPYVNQYHHNIPSFGEWGWTIATKDGIDPLYSVRHTFKNTDWLNKGVFKASFEFGKGFLSYYNSIKENHLDGYVIYDYYKNDWNKSFGIAMNE